MTNIDVITIISIAFLGSFGHCIGMCGGIVIAYSSNKIQSKWSKVKQSSAHIAYSIGRITTYSMIGVLFGLLGYVLVFSSLSVALLFLFTGLAMILSALSLLGKFKFLTLIEHSISKNTWYQKSFTKLLKTNSISSFFVLGLLNGLLPCGFVYFFAITAASTASPFYGGIVMLIFGLSTIPALFSLGFFVGMFKNNKLRMLMLRISAVLVLVFGVYTIMKGYMILTTNKSPINHAKKLHLKQNN